MSTTSKLTTPVLVLNKHFVPTYVTVAKNAFRLLYGGKAKAVAENFRSYDFDSWMSLPAEPDEPSVRTTSCSIRIPQVILLTTLDRTPRHEVRFSKKNIFLRDSYKCQYCGAEPEKVNLDHIHPVSRGGKTTWENVVTSCLPCNDRKADKLLHEIGMQLLRPPKKPSWHPGRILGWVKGAHPSWNPYLAAAL